MTNLFSYAGGGRPRLAEGRTSLVK